MDWERQDNEIRGLLEGSAFLPDGETWNAEDGWQKLQQKRQPERRKTLPLLIRLAVAACFAGLLGFCIWYMKQPIFSFNPDTAVIKGDISETGLTVEKPEGIEVQVKTGKKEKGSIGQKAIIHRNDERIDHISFNKKSGNVGVKKIARVMDSDTAANVSTLVTSGENAGKVNEITNPGIPEVVVYQSVVVVPAPLKNTKTRVIHYNQLRGSLSTSPPVFVQSKNSFPEWDGFAMQSSPTHKQPPFQLKIDISSTPKKSL